MTTRWVPRPTPETRHFWDGTREHELRLQRCQACGAHRLPPQPFCDQCGSADTDVVTSSGAGRLHSYVISHLPAPGFEPPFVIAVVELDEGPRLITNVIGVDPDPARLPIDLPVEVVFEPVDADITLPLFRPSGEPA